MKLILPLLLAFFLLLQNVVYAQPDYWEKANLKYLEDYRNAQKAGPNSPAKNYAVDPKAIEDIISTWKKNKVTTYVVSAKQEAAFAESDRIRRVQDESARETAIDFAKKNVPYNNKFIEAGFTKSLIERESLIYSAVYGSTELSDLVKLYMSKLIAAKKVFEQEKKNKSLEILLPIVASYSATWETALEDLTFLQTRFPQQKSSIDTARLFCFAYYYGLPFFKFRLNGDTQNKIYNNNETPYKKEEMDAAFLALADNYPELALKTIASIPVNRNLFAKQLIKYTRNDKSKEAINRKYAWLAINSLAAYDLYTDLASHNALSSLTDFYGNEKFYDGLTVEDWKKIAIANDGYPMNVVKKAFFLGRPLNFIPFNEDQATYNHLQNKFSYLSGKTIFKNIELIASLGDPEALNTLGIGTVMGYTNFKKYDCVWIFEKAAQAGSIHAQFNLVFAGGMKLKGYTDADRKKAIDGFTAFIQTADSATLVTAVEIASEMGVSRDIVNGKRKEWYWYDAMPKSLIFDMLKRSAAQGNTNATGLMKIKYFD